jgi:hypothetical protein
VSAGLSAAGAADFVHSESPVRPAPTALTAFVGRTLKGPVDEPVLIDGFARFTQVFGGLWPDSPLSHAIEQYFEQGGETALVVRVTSGGRPPTIELPAGEGGVLLLAGLAPGAGEHLRASVDFDGIPAGATDRFNLVVQRVRERCSERVLAQEIHRGLSVTSDAGDHVANALSGSRLVRLAGAVPPCRPDPTPGKGGTRTIGYVDDNADGDDGRELDDYDLIGSEALRRGLFALEGQLFNFLCIPQPARGRDLGPGALLAAAAFCRRHHALLVVDPPEHWATAGHALSALQAGAFRSPDAIMMFPRVATADRLAPGRTVTCATAGVAAGLLARADRAVETWWRAAPSLALRPGCRPQTEVSAAQALQLAAHGVNVWGRADALLRSRRLLAWVALSIERSTRWAAREREEPDVQERACRQVLDFLQSLDAAGAFAAVGLAGRPFAVCGEGLDDLAATLKGEFRLLYGLEGPGAGAPAAWLLVQKASGPRTQAVAVNPYALRSRA